MRTAGHYRVTLGYCVVFVAWTLVLRRHYGGSGGPAAVAELGFGLPALEQGRWWTLVTGVPFSSGLGLLPQWQTIAGLALCERAFGHVRTVIVFLVGHVVAVVVVSTLLWTVADVNDPWLRTLAGTLDNGSSIGGFAVLGAWTASRTPTWRRVWRLGLGCYLACMLLLSGHVYDATHLVGFATGIVLGPLIAGAAPRGRPMTARWAVTAAAIAVGVAAGIWLGWSGGGNGGPFGWGPGHLS